jgi:hypothetical protein
MITKLIEIGMIGTIACGAIGGVGTNPALADISSLVF